MAIPHLGVTGLSIVRTVAAVLGYGAVVLYGAWIDGRRQAVRKRGLHPVTGSDGEVHAREDVAEEEQDDGSKRG